MNALDSIYLGYMTGAFGAYMKFNKLHDLKSLEGLEEGMFRWCSRLHVHVVTRLSPTGVAYPVEIRAKQDPEEVTFRVTNCVTGAAIATITAPRDRRVTLKDIGNAVRPLMPLNCHLKLLGKTGEILTAPVLWEGRAHKQQVKLRGVRARFLHKTDPRIRQLFALLSPCP